MSPRLLAGAARSGASDARALRRSTNAIPIQMSSTTKSTHPRDHRERERIGETEPITKRAGDHRLAHADARRRDADEPGEHAERLGTDQQRDVRPVHREHPAAIITQRADFNAAFTPYTRVASCICLRSRR